MPTYATLRNDIPIAFSGDASGNCVQTFFNDLFTGDPPDSPNAKGDVKIEFPWGGTVEWTTVLDDLDPAFPVGPHSHRMVQRAYVVLRAYPGMTPVSAYVDLQSATVPARGSQAFSTSWTGAFSFVVRVAEFATFGLLDPTEAVYYPDPSDPNSLPFPITGGNAMPDSIPARKREHFVSAKDGQTVTITASVGTASVSQSFVWGGDPFAFGVAATLFASGYEAEGACSANPKVSGKPIFAQASHHRTGGGASFAVDGAASLSAAGTPVVSARLEAAAESPTTYRIAAKVVGADGAPAPWPLSVSYPGGSLALSGGSGSAEVLQREWSCSDYLGGSLVASDGVSDEKVWMTAALASSSLRSAHLDRRDWRLMFRTDRCAGIALSQAASTAIVPAGFSGWSGGAAGGIGYRATAGGISCALPSGGAPDRTLWGGYRYFEAVVKAPIGTAVTATLANGDMSKTYSAITTSAAPAALRFDTAAPTNVPANGAPTTRDSRYPLRPMPTHGDSPVNAEPDDDPGYLDAAVPPNGNATDPDEIERRRTWIWGATDVSTLSLSFALPAGSSGTPEVGAVSLVRSGAPRISIGEGFCGQGKIVQDGVDCPKLWPMTAAGGRTTETGAVWGAPLFTAMSDGRVVYDLPGNAYRQFVVGGYEWAYDSASKMAANLGHYPGWTCADLAPAANYYGLTTSTAWANCLGGEGLDYDGTTWTVWIDRGPGAIPVQDLYDWVKAWPGCGDVFGWGSGALGDPCVLAVGKILGIRAQGLAIDSAEHPVNAAPVRCYRTDYAVSGSVDAPVSFGTTDAAGVYSGDARGGPLGTPTPDPTNPTYVPPSGGNPAIKTIYWLSPFPQDEGWARMRFVERASFFPAPRPPSSGSVHNLATRDGRFAVGIATADGSRVRTWDKPTPDSFPDADVSVASGAYESTRVGQDSALTLYVALGQVSGGTVSATLRKSNDSGRTWSASEAMPITGCRFPLIHGGHSGELVAMGFVPDTPSDSASDGVLKASFRGPGDSTWGAVKTLKLSGGADLRVKARAFGHTPASEGAGRWIVTAVPAGADVESHWASSDYATDFTVSPL